MSRRHWAVLLAMLVPIYVGILLVPRFVSDPNVAAFLQEGVGPFLLFVAAFGVVAANCRLWLGWYGRLPLPRDSTRATLRQRATEDPSNTT